MFSIYSMIVLTLRSLTVTVKQILCYIKYYIGRGVVLVLPPPTTPPSNYNQPTQNKLADTIRQLGVPQLHEQGLGLLTTLITHRIGWGLYKTQDILIIKQVKVNK